MTVSNLTPITSSVVPARTRPRRDPDWMLQQLPVAMAGEEFFSRFVRIFQTVGTTLFDDADNIDHVLDVTVAPAEMVRWLGSWIGMTSLDESVVVECELVGEPCRTGRSPDEDEQGFGVDCASGARPVVLDDETLEEIRRHPDVSEIDSKAHETVAG